jgi:SAM-dependent methyltransferase
VAPCAERLKPYADHFSRLAPSYASCRPGYPDELFAYLGGLVPRRELAWDCAAGSGQATVPLAAIFQRVVATDISASMLGQAPRHPRIEYRVAPEASSGLDPGSADLVTVAQALHWLDIDSFYAEVRRVLVPGGVLAVWTYGSQSVDDGPMDDVLARFYGEVVGPYWPPERRYVESGYRTLPFPFSELEAPPFAMEERWTLSQLLGYIRTWSATHRYREAVGRDPVEQLARDLSAAWGAPDASRPVRWPLSVRIGRRPLETT